MSKLASISKALSCSVLALSVSPAVFAQSSDSTSFALGEIVVTATRTETSLQETAVAVTALSGVELERSNIKNLQDVATLVPSLSIGNRSGEGAAGGSVSLRGMGVDSQESAAAVGTYIDDVYYASDKGNILGLMDVERVEVLRGPQGTLFGRNTIAGAIQYVTVAPGDEFEGYVRGSFGEIGTKDITGAINVPVSDTFAVRAAGMYRESDGWVRDELNGGTLGDNDSLALRLRARWAPTDALTADLKYERVEQSSTGVGSLIDGVENNALFLAIGNNSALLFGQGNFPPNVLDDSLISTDNLNPREFTTDGINSPDFWNFDMNQFSLNLTYDISENLSIKSITSYSEYSSELRRDLDATPLSILDVTFADEDVEAFTQEIQLSGTAMDGRLNFTTGAYYFDSTERNTNSINIIGYPQLSPPAPVVPGPQTSSTSLAFFAQAGYDLTDALTLTAGYRYTDETVKAQQQQGAGQAQEFNFSDSSPYVGLDYRINDDAMVYAKYSQGFRAGGRTVNALLPNGGVDFDPEEATTIEAGMRLDFLDGRFRFNPTAYFTDWKSVQSLNIVNTAAGPVVGTNNTGDADINGVELEGQFAATENLVFRGSYSYMDAAYSSVTPKFRAEYPNGVTFISPGPGIPPVVPTGAQIVPSLTVDTDLQRAPEHKISIGATHTYGLANGGDIQTSADYAWVDEQKAGLLDTAIVMPAYGLLNGRVQYNAPDNQWNVAAYVKNLGNEFYLNGGADYAAGYTVGVRVLDVGRPREFGVAAAFNF